MRRRRAAENENNGENDNNNNDNNSNNSNNDNHGDQEHADQAEPEQEPPVLERQSTGFFVRWNRRLRRTLIVSAVLLVFFIAYLCLPHYCEPCRSTLDQGEWKTPDHAFPTHYRVREKKKILFNLFQV